MPVYRRKPGRIEAVQWQDRGQWSGKPPSWVIEAINRPKSEAGRMFRDEDDMMVQTPDGWQRAKPGDYVIRRGNGQLHVCAGEVFQQCFERDDKKD